jgi:uncharacterized protein (DUF1778 family)
MPVSGAAFATLENVRYITVQAHSGSSAMSVNARLDLRLSASDRQRIDRAAALAGLPIAAFVRTAVLREADRLAAAENSVNLSPAESRRFLAALAKPFAPNEALRRALQKGEDLGL